MAQYDSDNIIFYIDFSTGRGVKGFEALGKVLFCEPEVAKRMLATKDTSSLAYFGNPESLVGQLREAGLTFEAGEIEEIKSKYSVGGQITETGRMCAAYYLSPALSYFMYGFKPIKSLDELLLVWQTYGLSGRNGNRLTDSLSDPVFSYWLWHRNPHMALRVREMQERGASPGEIAYAMFPDMSYDFKTGSKAQGRIDTPEEIGEDLNAKLADYITNNRTLSASLIDFELEPGGHLEWYMKSHDQCASKLPCLKSLQGQGEVWAMGIYAPYNPYVKIYRFIKALGYKPYYQFGDGKKVYDLGQLEKIPAATIRQALEKGRLSAWIATFFQEDPGKSISDENAYARESMEFTAYIASICPTYLPAAKYCKALKEIDESARSFCVAGRHSVMSKLLKWIFAPAAFIMLLLALVLGFKFPMPDLTFIPDGAAIHLTWVYLAVVTAVLVFFIVKLRKVYKRVPDYEMTVDIANPDFRLREMNALMYAYSSDPYTKRGDSAIMSYIRRYKANRKKTHLSQLAYSCGGILAAILLMAVLYFLSPAFGREDSIKIGDRTEQTVDSQPEKAAVPTEPKPKKKAKRKPKVTESTGTGEHPAAVGNSSPATEETPRDREILGGQEVEEVSIDDLSRYLKEQKGE